jgi:hypothetical protein
VSTVYPVRTRLIAQVKTIREPWTEDDIRAFSTLLDDGM